MLWIAILFLNLALAHDQDLGHTATAEALRAGAMAKQKEIEEEEKKEAKTDQEKKEKEDKLKKLKADQMQLLSEMQKHLAAQGQLKQSDGQKGQQMAGGGSGGGGGEEKKKPPMMPPPSSGGEKKDDDKKKDEKKDTAEKPAEKPPIDLNAKSSEKDSSEKQTVSKDELKDLKALLDGKEKEKEKEGGVSYSKKVDATIKDIEASSNAAVQEKFKQALAIAESNDEKFHEKETQKAKEVAEETAKKEAVLKTPAGKLSRSLFADAMQGSKKKSAKETLGKPRRARGIKNN